MSKYIKRTIAMIVALGVGTGFAAVDLGEHFAKKEAWEESATDFAVEHARDGFTFASQKRDIVNCLRRTGAKWFRNDVWETRVYYGTPNEGPTRVEMSLYNRGDRKLSDDYSREDLDRLIAEVNERCAPGTKLPKSEKTKLKTGGFQYRIAWTKCEPAVEIVWGVGEAKNAAIQYVRATMTPKAKEKPKGAVKSVSGQASAAKVKANVKKNPDGDVWIDGVPMVNQGQKGYCAAAVSERILRYYGHSIDEHEIAQQAGSEARTGTRVSDMIEVIKNIGTKKRLGFNEIVSTAGNIGDLEKEIEQYNKAAKSLKEEELSLHHFRHGNMIMVDEIYDRMKPKVLKKMRTKDSKFKKFLSGVKTQVDKGIPICWGVTLGIFPEPGLENLQGRGGHMRLIIGYNAKTHEILYSDTWGAGHELKRMPEDWAFTITHNAFFLRPL